MRDPRFEKLMRVGAGVLALKTLLLALVLLAIYMRGISGFHSLWLGAEILPVNDTVRTQFGVNREGGVLINQVLEHAPADDAGLKRGDILLNIDGLPIYEAGDIRGVLKEKKFRDVVQLVYLRDGVAFSTKLVLDYQAANAAAATVRSAYRYRLIASDSFELAALGLLAGTLSGLIGCGGGVLKVSLLIVLLGFEIYLAKVVSLVSCGFMSMSSSYRYVKQGRVDLVALKYLIPSAVLGSLIGIGVSMMLDRHVLEFILGLFLVYTALDAAHQVYVNGRNSRDEQAVAAPRDRSVLVWAGLPTGLFSTVLGITGGVIGTPMQRYLLKTPVKTRIANTLVTAIFVSFLGGGLLLIEGLVHDYFSFKTIVMVLLAIIPGSVIGGQLGARLNEKLPANYIKGIYAVVILLISFKILTSI